MNDDASAVSVRLWSAGDDVAKFTQMLHRAYKELADAGWNITAATQDEETTARRISEGVCFVAVRRVNVVGTATLVTEFDSYSPPIYLQPEVAVLGQFGVEPEFRGLRIGQMLLEQVESEARARAFTTLALDTPQPAVHLVEYYQRRGFVPVGEHQWSGKTYRSLLMAKPL